MPTDLPILAGPPSDILANLPSTVRRGNWRVSHKIDRVATPRAYNGTMSSDVTSDGHGPKHPDPHPHDHDKPNDN